MLLILKLFLHSTLCVIFSGKVINGKYSFSSTVSFVIKHICKCVFRELSFVYVFSSTWQIFPNLYWRIKACILMIAKLVFFSFSKNMSFLLSVRTCDQMCSKLLKIIIICIIVHCFSLLSLVLLFSYVFIVQCFSSVQHTILFFCYLR